MKTYNYHIRTAVARGCIVAELHFEFAQLLTSYAPISLAWPPVESNTLELSSAFGCHGFWLSFLMQSIKPALSRNPLPERGLDTRQWPKCALNSYNY
jgi:hypothetical protein